MSCGADRHTPLREGQADALAAVAAMPLWERFLYRATYAIDMSEKLIERSYRAMNAAERAPGGWRLTAAAHKLVLVPDWMERADRHHGRALEILDLALQAMALEPRMDAPDRITKQSLRVTQMITRLSVLMSDLAEVFPRVQAAMDAAREAAAEAKADDERLPIIILHPDWRHDFLGRLCRLSDGLRSLFRRRRSPSRAADAPRRISRGRAPPFAAICQPCF